MNNDRPTSRQDRGLATHYPEMRAGGFTRDDGFVPFFTRVRALLDADSTVLDFGAGRGSWQDSDLPRTHRELRDLHTVAKSVVGVDVDPVVTQNPALDEAHVVAPGQDLPFADESFDLVLAEHVLEHVAHADAASVAGEVMRVLRPGGWLAAVTPFKWGMIGVGARIVPNQLHSRVLDRLQPDREERDIFPTAYAMNTRKDLRALFPEDQCELVVMGHTSEPRYFGSSRWGIGLGRAANGLTPPGLEPTLMAFVRRKYPAGSGASTSEPRADTDGVPTPQAPGWLRCER